MIDVKHGGLSTLEHHRLSRIKRLVDLQRGIRDHRPDPLGVCEQLIRHSLRVNGLFPVDFCQHAVLRFQCATDLLAENRLVKKVLNAYSHPRGLIGVAGADTTPGRPYLAGAERTLGEAIEFAPVGRDDMCVGRNTQA